MLLKLLLPVFELKTVKQKFARIFKKFPVAPVVLFLESFKSIQSFKSIESFASLFWGVEEGGLGLALPWAPPVMDTIEILP